MKKISCYKNFELRNDQFEILIDILKSITKRNDLKKFLECFLSKSEIAYLGQRLDIMRMLAKDFSYQQIKDKINASANTISHAKDCLEIGGSDISNILTAYKYKKDPEKIPEKKIEIKKDNWIKPHYPGAINF